MLLVDNMPTGDIPKHVDTCLAMQWSDASTTTRPTVSASALSLSSGAQQLSDVLDHLQSVPWNFPEGPAAALGPSTSLGASADFMAGERVAQSDVSAVIATAQGSLDAILDAWEISFLEELSKGDQAPPMSAAQTLPPPTSLINIDAPFRLTRSTPADMSPVELQHARAAWTEHTASQPVVTPSPTASQVIIVLLALPAPQVFHSNLQLFMYILFI